MALTLEWLPLGSVVNVAGSPQPLVVAGYVATLDDGRIFDYMGVPYPMGLSGEDDGNGLVYFNREGIDQLLFMGLQLPMGMSALERLRDEIAPAIEEARGEMAAQREAELGEPVDEDLELVSDFLNTLSAEALEDMVGDLTENPTENGAGDDTASESESDDNGVEHEDEGTTQVSGDDQDAKR